MPEGTPPAYAHELEAAIARLHDPMRSYVDRWRYRCLAIAMAANVRRNPGLLALYPDPVVLCTRTPVDLARGTPLHDYYMRRQQEEAEKYSRDLGEEAVPESALHRCGRCKSRRVTYYSMQTRSADEPMTNYFTCHSCKRAWKA